jgi:DNA-binding NarL/FixJ family response regulator
MTEDSPKKIKLMLVEDHVLARLGLKVSLEKYPNLEIVAETANGKEAIELANNKKPDLIIMDIGLIVLDGIEATKKIKEANPNIRIIMLTSHEAEHEIMASLASGADGYCLKDTSPEQLYTAVQSVNEGNAWLSSQVAEKVLRNFYGKEVSQIKQSDFTNPIPLSGEKKQTKSAGSIPIVPLSDREIGVLELIVEGKSNQEIGAKLFLSTATIKSHVRNILNKLSVDDRTQAAVKAMREGLVKF